MWRVGVHFMPKTATGNAVGVATTIAQAVLVLELPNRLNRFGSEFAIGLSATRRTVEGPCADAE